MKILHLINALSWSGGIETYVLSLLPRLASAGHEPLVLYARGNDACGGPAAHRMPHIGELGRSAERRAYGDVSEFIAVHQPDLVHVHNTLNLGAVRACLEQVPTVVTTHNYQWICPAQDFFLEWPEEICQQTCGVGCLSTTVRKKCMSLRPNHAWYSYRRARFGVRNAHRFRSVIAPCGYAAERHIRAGFSAECVHVLPYFCPIEPLFEPRLEPSAATITFLGRVRQYKGYQYFVQALSRLPESVNGLIVGDADEATRSRVVSLARQAGCADRLYLEPWTDRTGLGGLFARTSIFVFPSIWPETLGIVGLEALAHGVPVVAFDVGGVREWLIEGRTGRLAPVKDVAALAGAIKQLLDDRAQAREFGMNGIQLIRERFSIERHMAELQRLYVNACHRG